MCEHRYAKAQLACTTYLNIEVWIMRCRCGRAFGEAYYNDRVISPQDIFTLIANHRKIEYQHYVDNVEKYRHIYQQQEAVQ